MTDPWSQALAEAYASADSKVDILDTIELRHAALVDDEENPSPIYLVIDERDWDLKIEDAAAVNGGETVTFRSCMFNMELPDSSEGAPVANVSIDAVDRSVVDALEEIIPVRGAIEVIYRAYVAPADGDPAPSPDWVIDGMRLNEAAVEMLRMSGTLTFDLLSNKAFPSPIYTRRIFAGLAR